MTISLEEYLRDIAGEKAILIVELLPDGRTVFSVESAGKTQYFQAVKNLVYAVNDPRPSFDP